MYKTLISSPAFVPGRLCGQWLEIWARVGGLRSEIQFSAARDFCQSVLRSRRSGARRVVEWSGMEYDPSAEGMTIVCNSLSLCLLTFYLFDRVWICAAAS